MVTVEAGRGELEEVGGENSDSSPDVEAPPRPSAAQHVQDEIPVSRREVKLPRSDSKKPKKTSFLDRLKALSRKLCN